MPIQAEQKFFKDQLKDYYDKRYLRLIESASELFVLLEIPHDFLVAKLPLRQSHPVDRSALRSGSFAYRCVPKRSLGTRTLEEESSAVFATKLLNHLTRYKKEKAWIIN